MRAIVDLTGLTPPKTLLDAVPTIASREDADTALLELSWLQAMGKVLQAKHDEQLRRLNAELELAAVVEYQDEDGKAVDIPLGERIKTIEFAVIDYCDARRAELCPGEAKSCKFRYGVAKWRKAKDSVAWLEDRDEKQAKESVGSKSGLLAKCEELLTAFNWFGIFTVNLSFSKAAAVKAHQKKQVDDKRLASVGLKFVPGVEFVSIETHEFVRSGSS